MIKLKSVTKRYTIGSGEFLALKSIDLEIKKGEFVAIVGQSGSGKSTLMNIIGLLDTPSMGSYEIDGSDVSRLKSNDLAKLRREKFGFIFQRYNLLPTLNALQNVALPAIYDGSSKDEREKRAGEILSNLELGDKLNSTPNKLSGGQQQRVSIARALMNGGEVILADEPTGALDSKSGLVVMEIIKNLNKQGHTIILVTHDKNIANYANRIIEIKDGLIISDTTKSSQISPNLPAKKATKHSSFNEMKNSLVESFKMSISSIMSHKLRSLLTMLGIIIGIASVICVVALGKGSEEKILSSIRAIGTNTITIYPGKSFGDMRANRVKTLTVDDSRVLGLEPYLDYSTPNTSSSGVLTYRNLNKNVSLRGGGEFSLAVNGIEIASGRDFTKDDIKNSSLVAVIDDNTKNEFFKDENPLGKTIIFNQIPLTIIGVAKEDDNWGSDTLRIYAPFSAVINKITGDRYIHSITVKVSDWADPQMAEDSIVNLLTLKHGKKDFFTRNSDSIRQTVEATAMTMRILISSIAFISLVVGGIGVMNIMLVSVTERTKEIGIRMAVGAKRSDILWQFLIEATILCIIGGIIGLSLAYILGILFNMLSAGFMMKFSLAPAILALFTSSFIGIVFGYIPARNASNLNPIDALGQE